MTKRIQRPKQKPGRKPKGPNQYRVTPEGHAAITIGDGIEALCDLEDLPTILAFRWCATGPAGKQQAGARRTYSGPMLKMSRIILGLTDPKTHADHINHNTLDNRRSNLRAATQAQNTYNRRMQKNNTTGAVGVVRFRGKFRAQIGKSDDGGRQQILAGIFDTVEEASAARDSVVRALHGEFAHLNLLPKQT
jgi:hypothetical protein